MLISLLLLLLFGAVVGWIAGLIMNSGRSLLGNIILGIIGSLVGGFIASLLGFGSLGGDFSFSIANMAIAVAGACLVTFIAGLIKGKK